MRRNRLDRWGIPVNWRDLNMLFIGIAAFVITLTAVYKLWLAIIIAVIFTVLKLRNINWDSHNLKKDKERLEQESLLKAVSNYHDGKTLHNGFLYLTERELIFAAVGFREEIPLSLIKSVSYASVLKHMDGLMFVLADSSVRCFSTANFSEFIKKINGLKADDNVQLTIDNVQ